MHKIIIILAMTFALTTVTNVAAEDPKVPCIAGYTYTCDDLMVCACQKTGNGCCVKWDKDGNAVLINSGTIEAERNQIELSSITGFEWGVSGPTYTDFKITVPLPEMDSDMDSRYTAARTDTSFNLKMFVCSATSEDASETERACSNRKFQSISLTLPDSDTTIERYSVKDAYLKSFTEQNGNISYNFRAFGPVSKPDRSVQ